MSISHVLKSAAVISIGAFIGYSTVKFIMPEQKNRYIASFPIAKMGKEQNARLLFDIKTDTSELAQNENDVSTIKITVQALRNFNAGLTYVWNLPQDSEIIEGTLSSDLGAFSANESKEFIIKAKGFSKQLKKYISFEVQGDSEQFPIRREVLISSRIEDSFEYVIQQNELNKSKNQMNKLDAGNKKSKFSPENVVR